MRERVNVIMGKNPTLIIVPHGTDDKNTATIGKEITQSLDAFAVINQGFDRNKFVDVDNDKADCNSIEHCKSDVVYEEFLKPIIKIKNIISRFFLKNKKSIDIFHIHGCGDKIHSIANENVGLILGYGLGLKKDSLTCDIWRKDLFIHLYRQIKMGGDIFEGKGGGKYAGRSSDNLNQYFRKHDLDNSVQSMQLEIPYNLRKNDQEINKTCFLLKNVIQEYSKHNFFHKKIISKFI